MSLVSSVLLPYRFTLFSNGRQGMKAFREFYYLIDLHYSQTMMQNSMETVLFYYLIDLHYSQTIILCTVKITEFYYLIDLHYSQTRHLIQNTILNFTTL